MRTRDIDLNFIANPLTGDVNLKNDNDAIKQSLKTLLLLGLYEKPFNSNLGPNIKGFLFQNYILNSDKYLEDTIKNIISVYEPRITIKTLRANADDQTNSINIYLEYYYIGQTVNEINLKLERIR